MQINSISGQNFGKIIIDDSIKDELLEQTAYGIGYEDSKVFKEKFRLCDCTTLGQKYDIFVSKNGVKVHNKAKGGMKEFSADKFPEDTPNLLYHLFHAAMNYVDLDDTRIFK